MANSQLLFAGTGGVSQMFVAPTGTTLPTDTTTALNAAFKDAGYLDANGVVISHALNTNPVQASGTLPPIRVLQAAREDTIQVTMLEFLNPVAKAVYNKMPLTGTGSITVTTDATKGIYSVAQGLNLVTQYAAVFVWTDGLNVVRKVAPFAEVTTMGDETFQPAAVAGLSVTLTCYPDNTGQCIYEYDYATALHA